MEVAGEELVITEVEAGVEIIKEGAEEVPITENVYRLELYMGIDEIRMAL